MDQLQLIRKLDKKKLKKAKKIIVENKLFDENYYKQHYQDNLDTDELFEHYLTLGYKKGYNPSAQFDNDKYINEHKELSDYQINPLIYYALYEFKEEKSEKPRDIEDLTIDKKEIMKYEKGTLIVSKNKDIAQRSMDINSKIKYLNEKSQQNMKKLIKTNENIKTLYNENKTTSIKKTKNELTEEDINKAKQIIEEDNLFDDEYYNQNYPYAFEKNINLLDHYIDVGYMNNLNPSEYFNTEFYMQYDDVAESKMNPLIFHVLYDLNKDRKTTNQITPDDVNDAIKIIRENNLFDSNFYYKQIPQLKNTIIDPLMHYIYIGYKHDLNPSNDFNTQYYKQKYLKEDTQVNPLIHYVIKQDDAQTKYDISLQQLNETIETIYNSNTFDDEYYIKQTKQDPNTPTYELIKHYILTGANQKYNPNKIFNTQYYQQTNPEISTTTPNPYYHYLTCGKRENKQPIQTRKQLDEIQKTKEELDHQAEVIEKSTLFDEDYYLEKYEDVKHSLKTPAQHYVYQGYKEHKNPSRYFDNNYYMYKYKDEIGDINPLYHYITKGKDMGYISKYYFSQMDKHEVKIAIATDIIAQNYPKFDERAPKVSIIILNHNGEKYIENQLNSLFESTDYPNYDVTIIENDSNDKSPEIIDKLSTKYNFKVIKNKINETLAKAYNKAVKEVDGEYVVFMDNDIELLDGWLNHLMQTQLTNIDVGVVGGKLIYPDLSHMQSHKEKSYKIQHAGIKFKQENGYILPYSYNDGKAYKFNQHETYQTPAITGSLMMISRQLFSDVGGFDEDFKYEYEAVDLSLRLHTMGYKNIYTSDSAAYHYRHATKQSIIEGLIKTQHENNKNIFARKWNKWLKQKVLNDKINKNNFFTENPLKITFITMEKGENAAVGDYFIAQGLANELRKQGYIIDFKSKNDTDDPFKLDDDVDILISLLNSYDIDKIKTENDMIIKIAWILNWPEWWLNKPYFESFDMILCSNSRSIHHIIDNSGYEPILFPEATNTDLFNMNVKAKEEYICDYAFAGNDWHDEREITEILQPDESEYSFNIYGKTWSRYDKFNNYNKGYVPYSQMPAVYASTKIVLDDATDLTDAPSSVNSRVFDALAMGKLVITNGEIGIKELFGNKIPTFTDKQSLDEQLDLYLNNPDLAHAKVEELQYIVLKNHTYKNRAEQLINLLKDLTDKTRVIIKIPTPKSDNKHHWGDYHFGVELQKEFNKQGYPAKLQLHDDWQTNKDALYDIVLVLRGVSSYTPKPYQYNIEWNISHPNRLSVGEYDSFDKVYIASEYWCNKIKPVISTDVEPLLQCTNPQRFHRLYDEEYKSQLLFVGNSRMTYRRILQDLLPTDYDLKIYGNNWEGILDERYIQDNYIPNEELYRAYSSTDVLLNDHWDDMRKKGFISNRIFDGLACGATIVTDHVKGIENLFKDEVLVYEDKMDLNEKIKEAIKREPVNPNVINEHTYAKRVEKIIKDYENMLKNKIEYMKKSN